MGSTAPSNTFYAWVSGAGPTGCIAALGLAAAGWKVVLHDPTSMQQLRSRSRAYALTHSSKKLLTELGIWQELIKNSQAFKTLQLSDSSNHKSVCFHQNNQDLGWIINHPNLMDLLLERCRQNPLIESQSAGNWILWLAIPAGMFNSAIGIAAAATVRWNSTSAYGLGNVSPRRPLSCTSAWG